MGTNLLYQIENVLFSLAKQDQISERNNSLTYNSILNELKSFMKAGDIIIAEPARYSNLRLKDWVARGSRVVQNTRWGHTGLYDGNDLILEARVDVLFGKGKKFDGMTCRTLKEYIAEQNFLIVRPIADDKVKHLAVERMKALLNNDHLKYDKFRFIEGGLDIMGIRHMKARNCEEQSRIICSEAIAFAYQGWIDFINGRHCSQILPTHILYSKKVKHIAIVDRDKSGNAILKRLD
jgi:hypothetical protein